MTTPRTPLVNVPAGVPDIAPRVAADATPAVPHQEANNNQIHVPSAGEVGNVGFGGGGGGSGGGGGGGHAAANDGKVAVPGAPSGDTNYQAMDHTTEGGGAPPAYGSEAAPSMISMNRIRVTFGMFLLGGFVFSLLLQYHAVTWILKWVIEKDITGHCAIGNSADDFTMCMGAQGAYRVSFALFLFFLVHYVLSHRQNLCLEPEARVGMNQGWFLVKCVLVIGLILICFLIPNNFFVFYAWLSFVLSIIFLVAQLLVLIEFAYEWANDWSKREDPRYQKGLLVCSILMLVGGVVIISLGFKWFGSNSDCGGNQAALILSLIVGILCLALCVHVGKGTIVPGSVVFIYCAWTCFGALSSSSDTACRGVDTSDTTQMILSAVFTACSLVISTLSAATSHNAFSLEDMTETGAEGDAVLLTHFHGIMILASSYLCMLVTNWTIVGSSNMASIYGNKNNAALGAKLGSEALCFVLFLWTLAAPFFCKSRRFE